MRVATAGVCSLVLASCAPVQQGPVAVPRSTGPAPRVLDEQVDLPPVGYGSLRQDEFSLELTEVALHVKITPLAEQVIRLAAPDTYERLRALAGSRSLEADRLTEARGAELFLVSFYSREPNVAYRPEMLRITHRGRARQPVGIIPLTTGWGRQLLQPQETQSAIYVFEPPFDYDLALSIRYGLQESENWYRSVLPRLERERTRVAARSGGADGP